MSDDEMIRIQQKNDAIMCRVGPFIPALRLSIKLTLFLVSPIARVAQRLVAFERYSLDVLDAVESYLADRKHVH
jgi:hypothetical protein